MLLLVFLFILIISLLKDQHTVIIFIICFEMKVWRRPSIGQAGPLGGDFPLVTREGHNVLDVIFTSPIVSLGKFFNCDACFKC